MKYSGVNKIKNIYKVAKQAGEPVLIIGKHGIGKSQSVAEFAKENGYHYQPLFLSHQEVADLIGIPVEKDGKTIWTKPVWLTKMEEAAANGKDCVLFLDELNRAQLDVRQVALQLVLDGEIHQHKLPSNTFIVAAINPTDDDSNDYQVEELDAALLDRFLVVELEPDAKEWINYAIEKGLHPLVIKFISKFPEYLYKEDKNSGMTATNRSWEKVSRLLESFEKTDFEDQELKETILVDIINGKVGPIPGHKFIEFYKTEKSFGVDELERYSTLIKNKIGKDNIEYVYNKIKDANEPYSDVTIDDVITDQKIQKVFGFIKKIADEVKKEWNIESAEVHYLFKNFYDKYKEQPFEYYIEMTLIMHLATKELITSYLRTLDDKPLEKIKLGYTIPFQVKELVEILESDLD